MEGSLIIFICLFFFVSSLSSFSSSQARSQQQQQQPSDSCRTNLKAVAHLIPFDTSSLRCFPAWRDEDFILWFANTGPGRWSYVVSAPDTGSYVAVGFSADGGMVGSAAVVGWAVRAGGPGLTKQYYLGGTDSAQCPPVSSLARNTSIIVSGDSRLYLAFQIHARRPQPYLICSVGPKNDLPSAASGYYLSEHRDAVSMAVDYTNGLVPVPRGGSGLSSARRHGLLVLLGWGVLMPVGVAVARYFKQHDPHWFYGHFVIQGIGFVLGLAGIVIGFGLDTSGVNNVGAHKALGIAILALGSLQVTTLLARPDRASKARKYWNWCHHWVGRAAIACATGNIFLGLAIAHENSSWSITHRVFLAVLAVAYVFLEVRKHTSDE